MSKTLFLPIGDTKVEVQYKRVHGGLVSGSTMAIVTKAQAKVTKARGLDAILTRIYPYMKTPPKADMELMSKEEIDILTTKLLEQAGREAMRDGKLSFSDSQKIEMSESELEKVDGEYYEVKMRAYCDILSGVIDFKAMEIEPLTANDIADFFAWETIKEIAEDFLDSVNRKPKQSPTSERSAVSPNPKKPLNRKIGKTLQL